MAVGSVTAMRRSDRAPGRRSRDAGFTLVELVLVMTLLAVMGSIGATFVSRIVAGQQDNRSRLRLAQAADGAVSRLATELEGALPNSVRVTVNTGGTWIEWVPVLDAGRYRQAPDTAAGSPGDTFTPEDGSDASFDVLGPPLAAPATGAQIVWSNLGTPESDVYAGSSRRGGLSVGNGGRSVAFTATGIGLPADSGGARFFIVGTPVTVACIASGSTLELRRFSGYGWQAGQPASALALASASSSLLLTGLADCRGSYGTALANIGLLNLRLALLDEQTGTRLDLMQQVAVDNTP